MSLVSGVGRLRDLYARSTASRSVSVLLIANAIPLLGVILFGWSLWTILVVYWLENGIVGFWNVPKILLARGSMLAGAPGMPPGLAIGGGMPGCGRVGLAAFFTVHYGLFWVVHGVFVFVLPAFVGITAPVDHQTISPLGVPDAIVDQGSGSTFGSISWPSVALGAVALFVSHGASFVVNYLGRGEYLRTSPLRLMFAPYARVVVLHLTILVGAFAVAFLGAPNVLLVVLVILKTALDLRFHLAERIRLADSGPQPPAEARSTNLP